LGSTGERHELDGLGGRCRLACRLITAAARHQRGHDLARERVARLFEPAIGEVFRVLGDHGCDRGFDDRSDARSPLCSFLWIHGTTGMIRCG
jgi:hypothetical protein